MMWVNRKRNPNSMKGVESFIKNWDEPTDQQIKKELLLRKSSSGNINYNGSLTTNKGPALISRNINFSCSLEDGIKNLVLVLIKEFNCITYTSCESHLFKDRTKIIERHIGILPRDYLDYIRIVSLFSSLWHYIAELESKFSSIEFGISKNELKDKNLSKPVLDFYIGKKQNQKWVKYFAEINLATEDLCKILRTEFKKNNQVEHGRIIQEVKFLVEEKYTSYTTDKKFPYDDKCYQKGILKVHKNGKTDQASRRPKLNDYIFNWLDQNLGGFRLKSIFHPLCGPGLEEESLLKFGYKEYLGIDQSESAVEFANESRDGTLNCKFVKNDFFNYSSSERRFDVFLLTYEAINSFSEQEFLSTLKLAQQVLHPTGFICGDLRLKDKMEMKSLNSISIIDSLGFVATNPASTFLQVIKWNEENNTLSKFYLGVNYSPIQISKIYEYFIWIPNKKKFGDLLKTYGFRIVKENALLKKKYTDVSECKNNSFFVAIRNQ